MSAERADGRRADAERADAGRADAVLPQTGGFSWTPWLPVDQVEAEEPGAGDDDGRDPVAERPDDTHVPGRVNLIEGPAGHRRPAPSRPSATTPADGFPAVESAQGFEDFWRESQQAGIRGDRRTGGASPAVTGPRAAANQPDGERAGSAGSIDDGQHGSGQAHAAGPVTDPGRSQRARLRSPAPWGRTGEHPIVPAFGLDSPDMAGGQAGAGPAGRSAEVAVTAGTTGASGTTGTSGAGGGGYESRPTFLARSGEHPAVETARSPEAPAGPGPVGEVPAARRRDDRRWVEPGESSWNEADRIVAAEGHVAGKPAPDGRALP